MTIAFRSASSAGDSSGGNLVVSKPSGVADGDILYVNTYREAGTWTLPSGWEWAGPEQASANGNVLLRTAWKIASSEPSSWTFQLSTTTWRSISIAAFSTTGTGEIDVVALGANTPSSTAQDTVPSITTTVPNTMVVSAHGNYNGSLVNPASGYTEAVDLGGNAIHYKAYASAGATGSYNSAFVPSLANGGDWAAFHIAFREAAGGPTEKSASDTNSISASEGTADIYASSSRADDANLSMSDASALQANASANDTNNVSMDEAASLIVSASGGDDSDLSVVESAPEIVGSSDRTDDADLSLTEGTVSLAGSSSQSDTVDLGISDSASIAVILTRMDDANIAAVEGSVILDANVSGSDEAGVSLGETASIVVYITPTDALDLNVSETSALGLTPINVSDTADLALIEGGVSLTGSSLQSDEANVGLDESTDILVSISTSDDAGISVSDACALTVPVAAVDTIGVAAIEGTTDIVQLAGDAFGVATLSDSQVERVSVSDSAVWRVTLLDELIEDVDLELKP